MALRRSETVEPPFPSYWCELEEGKLHYMDEGEGANLLFLHGNPTWSFSYREPIRRLSATYRCLALDHLGFGLSDKPLGADLSLEGHIRRFKEFVEQKDLRGVNLVMNDWGGPIGLGAALEIPERFRSTIVLNSWIWPLNGSPLMQLYSRLTRGPLGRLFIRRWNALIRWGMPIGFADPKRLDAETKRAYEAPFAEPDSRRGQWTFARSILQSEALLERTWKGLDPLRTKPFLLLKGRKDLAFGKRTERLWREAFPDGEFHPVPDAGHFPQEERGDLVAERIDRFLKKLP
jgi:haloalkane dehalogenase